MLHRAIFGSLERFFGVLIESTAGAPPRTNCVSPLLLVLLLLLPPATTLAPLRALPLPQPVRACGVAGDFPLWLAPTQLRLLPVSDDFLPFCDEVQALGKKAGLRVEVDPGGRSLSKQVHPHFLVQPH